MAIHPAVAVLCMWQVGVAYFLLHVALMLAVARLNVYMWFSDQDGRMWDKLHHVMCICFMFHHDST